MDATTTRPHPKTSPAMIAALKAEAVEVIVTYLAEHCPGAATPAVNDTRRRQAAAALDEAQDTFEALWQPYSAEQVLLDAAEALEASVLETVEIVQDEQSRDASAAGVAGVLVTTAGELSAATWLRGRAREFAIADGRTL